MSELNKGIDLNKKIDEKKDLVDNLQWTVGKVWNKIDSTMDNLDENEKIQKIWKSKVVKKALNSKVVNNINDSLISSLKLIFIIIWSFFIVLWITWFIVTMSRLGNGWQALKLIFSGTDIWGWLFILLFLFLSFIVSFWDMIAGFAIVKQKKWGKTILLIMLGIWILMFLLSLVYLKNIFTENWWRAGYKWYVPNTIGAIFRLTFYIAITILVFKNYDTIVWKEKADDDEENEVSEWEEEDYEEEQSDGE